MWMIKFLKGPRAGQVVELKEGATLIGRAANCDIQVDTRGISKEHAKLIVGGSAVQVVDMGSTNGTFVNGVKIKNQSLKSGDKLGLFDVMIHVQEVAAPAPYVPSAPAYSHGPGSGGQVIPFPGGNDPYRGEMSQTGTGDRASYHPPKTLGDSIQAYMDNVLLPGVYKLGEIAEFRLVVAGFLIVFAMLVTGLSVIPMVQIMKQNSEIESQRRAMTIAVALAERYRRALQEGTTSTFSTRFADSEEGVVAALIISAADGHIVAPASKTGAYADLPFIYKARKADRKFTEQIDPETIGAAAPISVYSAETEGYAPSAQAVVIYNMATLAVDNGRVASLFIKVMFIALLLGALVYYLLQKFIEYPIRDIHKQLDIALRERKDSIKTRFDFPILEALVLDINSCLGRALSGGDGGSSPAFQDRSQEAQAFIQMMGCAGLALDSRCVITHVNSQFEDLMGMRLATLQGQSLSVLTDQALQLSIQDLVDRSRNQPGIIVTNDLDISGRSHEVDCAAAPGTTGQADYFLISIKPKGGFG